jgi:YD repeat-containing protein
MPCFKRFLAISAAILCLWSPLALGAQYTYDQRGRLTGVTESDGSTVTYTYDANGNILSITRTSATLPLTLSTFSPSSGPVGASITIHGTGFNPVAGQNAVTLNGQSAPVTFANATTIVATVPAGATSGLIAVTTAGNIATSTAPFGVTTLQITGFTPKIGPVGTVVVIDGAGFDQTPANNVVKFNTSNAVVSAATTTQLTVAVPTGATSGRVAVTAPAGSAASSDDFIIPPGTFTASQVAMAARLNPLDVGLVYTVNTTNKVAVALFDGAVGERLSLVLTNVSMFGTYRVYAPNGSLLTSSGLSSGITTIDLGPLQLSGTYSFVMIPTNGAGSATIRVARDPLITVLTDGTPQTMTLSSGQNAMLTFNGVAGESYNFAITNYTSTPEPSSISVSLLRADGSNVKNCWVANGTSCHFDIADTGAYTLRLDPAGLNATAFQARLNADLRFTVVPNSPSDMDLDKQGRNALLSFAVATGQDVTLNLASIVTAPVNQALLVRVYNAAGTQVTQLSSSNGNLTLNIPGLAAGSYTALVAPANAATATFRIGFVAALPIALAANGVTTPFSASLASQTAYFSFSGSQGQNLAIGLTNLAFASGAQGTPWVQVLRPDGSQLTTANCGVIAGSCQIPLRNLPLNGTYRIEVVTSVVEKLGFGVTLSQSVGGTLVAGTPFGVTFSSPGQNAVLTFTVATQQTLALNVGSLNLLPAGSSVMVRVYNATGTQVNSASSSTTASISLPNLVAGTYTVTIDPAIAATGSLLATLSQGTPVPVDGSSVGFAASSAGEKAYLTFAGTAGQRIGLGITNLSLSPASPTHVTVNVYKPDNSQFTYVYCYVTNTGCQLALRDLPTTGTYRIEVTPGGATQIMGFNLRLVPVNVVSITPSATAIPISLSTAGQFAEYSFVATAGQMATLRLAAPAMSPANSELVLRAYNPSGGQVSAATVTNTPATLNLTNLVAGTYRITIVPSYAATGSAEFTFAPPLSGALTNNGTSTNYSSVAAGQIGYFTFAGTAGQNLGLGITSLTQTPASPTHLTWRIYKPDGSQLLTGYCYVTNPGCQVALRNLPVVGTYRVELEPGSQQSSASYSLTLSQSNGGALTPGSAPLTSSFGVPGQNAMYTFTATAGQIVTLRIASMAMLPANGEVVLRVFNPAGSQVNTMTVTSTPATLNLTGLVAGTYGITIVPTYAATGSVQLTLAPGLTGSLVSNGSSSLVTSSVAGQNAYLTFSANAGDYVGFGITGLALTPNSPTNITVQLYRPDNSNIGYVYCYMSNTGCQLTMRNAPASGVYRLELLAGAQQTMSLNATLSQPVTGTLAAGTPLPITLTSPGQIAVVTFTATAGQSVPLTLSALAMAPAGSQVNMTVLGPAGNQIDSANATTTSITRTLNNLAAGTYTILLAPTYAATGSLQLSRP